jgi:DNA segregation ATPase FtsK/SpoIIIE-like protein
MVMADDGDAESNAVLDAIFQELQTIGEQVSTIGEALDRMQEQIDTNHVELRHGLSRMYEKLSLAPPDPVVRLDSEDEQIYERARAAVVEAGKASTAFLQRKFGVGYARAARLINLLEERGVIGPQHGAQPRRVVGK